MSVFPFPVVVARAGINGARTYAVSPEDVTVVVQEMPDEGLTVLLPGASSPVPPSDGDFYITADPHGLITVDDSLTVDGNGFPILGIATLVLTDPFSWAAFQFDAQSKLWIAFIGRLPPKQLELVRRRRLLGFEPRA